MYRLKTVAHAIIKRFSPEAVCRNQDSHNKGQISPFYFMLHLFLVDI